MKVIFACIHSAGRSQMAAAFYNLLAIDGEGISAGTQPAEQVHPEVITVMKEVGIDLSNIKPQLLTDDLAKKADTLITMGCGEACPYVPGLKRENWPLLDPKGKSLDEIRKIRDEIKRRIEEFVRKGANKASKLVVETASFNDYQRITQLLTSNNLPVPSEDDQPVKFLTTRQNERVIACLGWESYGSMFLLRSLAVDRSEQGGGVGTLLVQAALTRLAVEGAKEIYLLTGEASKFAERFGFKHIDRCSLPEQLKVSRQFTSDCCASANCMQLFSSDIIQE